MQTPETPLEETFFAQLEHSLKQLQERSIELDRRLASLTTLEGKLAALHVALNKQPIKQEKDADIIAIGDFCLPALNVLAWTQIWSEPEKRGKVIFHTPLGERRTGFMTKEQYDQLIAVLHSNLGSKQHQYPAETK